MSNNNHTNSDNPPNQTPNRLPRQAKKPDDRTDEAGYQKLPPGFRPFAGCAQRDPLDYESHPYPPMRRFAEFLALRFDAPRTRHSYYRQMRLVHEFCQIHHPDDERQFPIPWTLPGRTVSSNV